MITWLSDACLSSLYYLMRVFPLKKNKIVLSNHLGKPYGDSEKYIAEALRKRRKNYDIVWLAKDLTQRVYPKGIRVVKYNSLQSIFEQATAKIWIDNRRKPNFVRKRLGQFYIQTWHGNIALKRLEQDTESKLEPRYVAAAKKDSKMIDVFLSGSKWETECIRTTFWYDGPIRQIGYPRQDPLIAGQDAMRRKVKRKFKLPVDTKILLYAPTFRQSKDEDSLSVYSLNWSKVLAALSERFGGNWVGMIRLHPNIAALADKFRIPSDVINVTDYSDMQELTACCDCLITDYSSTVIEAGIADKVGFIFATDFEDYKKDRDVYFDIRDDLPFPFADDDDSLIRNILHFDQEKYTTELNHFLNDVYGVVRNGDASEKVCRMIDRVIEGRKKK